MNREYDSMTFVSMPWASTNSPILGIGVLSGKLRNSGYKTKTLNFNLHFANAIGLSNYESLVQDPELSGVVEYLFAAVYFKYDKATRDLFFKKHLENTLSESPTLSILFDSLVEKVIPRFIGDCASQICGIDHKVIGFTSTFNQVFASLLLARTIKEMDTDKIIVFGGPSFHGEMGLEYSRKFCDIVDYVFTGEADNALPAFMSFLNGYSSFEEIDGISKAGRIIKNSIPINNMDSVAEPEYDDYFQDIVEIFERRSLSILKDLPFESSRGCWYGQKNHCTFCGLNTIGMDYRSKSDERVLSEVLNLSKKYKVTSFYAADNILPLRAYNGFLKMLASEPISLQLFYEIKSNIKRKEIFQLYLSKVKSIQPGIESFSSNVLNIMKKGVSSIQNVQLLKLAKEYGIRPIYNILYEFYGETEGDYEETEILIKKIFHLDAPFSLPYPVAIHRFSPMYNDPKKFGYSNVRPAGFYEDLFPANFIDLNKIAYYFVRDNDFKEYNPSKLKQLVVQWNNSEVKLFATIGVGFIQILRTGSGGITERYVLDKIDSLIFMLTDEVAHRNILKEKLKNFVSAEELTLRLEKLTESNILINEGDKYLNLIPFSDPMDPIEIEKWINNELFTTDASQITFA